MEFPDLNPFFFALAILVSATFFTCTWILDAITHANLVDSHITRRELQTHRILIVTSGLMELSLLLMFWFRWEILPVFIAAFITRTAHEFIDEVSWHSKRCTFYETILHLIMWLTVLSKTFFLFIWGFFSHFKGVENLPVAFYMWGFVIVIVMGFVSMKEWNQKTVD